MGIDKTAATDRSGPIGRDRISRTDGDEDRCHIEAQCIYWPTVMCRCLYINHYVNTSVCYSVEAGLGVDAAHARTVGVVGVCVAPSGACRADGAVREAVRGS